MTMTSDNTVMVECGKTCVVIFLGLILMTGGFVLTLTGWFAPPMNNFVLAVRMGGPITLLVGFILLLCSCLMCAIEQGKCCHCCYSFFLDKSLTGLTIARHPETNGPLILHDDGDGQCAETQVDLTDDEDMHGPHGGELVIDESMVVVNENAADVEEEEGGYHDEQDIPPPSKYPKGYQPVATTDFDKVDTLDENDIAGLNGVVIPNRTLNGGKNIGKKCEVVPCARREVLVGGDRCCKVEKEYYYEELPSADPPCYTSILTANKNSEFQGTLNSNVNTVINSAFTPYTNSSCAIPRLKSLQASSASDTLQNTTYSQTELVTQCSPSISRPPIVSTSYPGAVCPFPPNSTCPSMRPSICGNHAGSSCPLTPKNRKHRSQQRKAERSSQATSSSHNINKVNRMCMDKVGRLRIEHEQLKQQHKCSQLNPHLSLVPPNTNDMQQVDCHRKGTDVSSQV